ncbi:PREDICTED: NACHT, LRR and PYD domains-containing protein 6-like [Branchiostoma belcheri]|uniref:NACHT, LRR and PYD domains-containing protein 6-like n=1 Tax=Branchiostoma belcheri TaxID=7741 RepID=A0A6P4YBN6_BRABE|nr:PREDICTED: NACHT, LRR and PYD domains-containing protein 6-like [Branchiostoma belcheri]
MDQKAPKAENPSDTTPGCSTGDEGATSAIQQSQGSGNMTVLDGQERETGHMDVQECYKDEDVVAFSETETSVTQIAGHSQVSGQGNKVINIGPNSTVTIFHGTSDDTNTVPSIGSPTEDFPLAQCQDALRAYFKTRMSYLHPLAWNETYTVKIQDVFTTVDLVTRTQQGGNIKRRALPSTVDALSARPDCPQPRRILVEGNAGIGKTTEVSKLAFDWAESEGRSPILEKYDLVFPIALRKVGESQSLAGCIFDQLLPEDVPFQESDLETYLKGNDRVLIILDGFDEWSKHEEHDVTKLLTGKILRECSLLVTTRPSNTPQLHSLMCPDTRVEITGFSQDNVRTYIHKFFKGDQGKAAALVKKMDSSLIPSGILATPILLLLTCIMWEENPDMVLGGRIGPLYDELVSFIIRRHCAKNNVASNQGIPDNIRDALLCAGALAFNGLLQNNLVYNKEDVARYCSGDSLQVLVLLGILHRQESPSRLNPSDQFSFSHKTMQEYFAGLYFAKTLQGEPVQQPTLNTYLRTAQSVRDLENVVVFACAKLGCEADVLLAHLVKIYQQEVEPLSYASSDCKYVNPSLYSKCRATGNEEEIKSHVDLNFIRYQTYLEIALLCFYESGCLSQFENIFLTKGFIQFSDVGPRVYNALGHVLKKIPSESLRNLTCLWLVNSWQCFVVPIMDTLKMMNLSELSLRSACLGGHDSNTGPCARLSQQLPHLTGLRKLVLSWNSLLCSDLLVLLPSLKTLVNLEELYLSGNRFAGCGKSLAELPCSLRSLKALKVYKCGLSLEEVLQIAIAVVQHCPKMTEFDYRRNKTGPGGDEKVLAVLRGKWPDATYRRGSRSVILGQPKPPS